MNYDQFRAEYDPIFDVADTESMAVLAIAVARLKALATTIEDPADRRIHTEAGAGGGMPAERIARAEAGMAAIGIAETAQPAEQASILDLNESLYMLIPCPGARQYRISEQVLTVKNAQ